MKSIFMAIMYTMLIVGQILVQANIAFSDDTLAIEKEMIDAAIKILNKDKIKTENYKISATSIFNSEYDANYVVEFVPKILPGEQPMFGGGYSVYFKRENNMNKFVLVVDEQ